MGFERKAIHGVSWFVCDGTASHGSMHNAAARLLDEYALSASGYLWGRGDGCWEALYLAERYNVRLLILEACRTRRTGRQLRALAIRNLFAVVCPVVICAPEDACPPAPPNAPVYRIEHAERLAEAIQQLI